MTTPQDTFDEGELAAQIERNRQLELQRQRAQEAARAAAEAAQKAQDEAARKQAEEAARIAREQQIAAEKALEARKRLAAQQEIRDRQQEQQESQPTPQVSTSTPKVEATTTPQTEIQTQQPQTPTDTFQEGEVAAQEIKQAEILGDKPVSTTASELQTKVTNIQERGEEAQASIERLEAGVRDITGGLTQQELVQSIQTQINELEPERLAIEEKNNALLEFQNTEIARQQKGYDALLRAIQDKIDRGIYTSQRELDAELELLGKSRNVLNEMVEKFNTDLEEINTLVERYNAKYNTIVQGPDYQNLQEVERYLQTQEAQSRIQEASVVNEAVDSLTAEIDAFNKNLEVLSINIGQSPETITTGISSVQDAELKAAIEGKGETDLHTVIYEGRPVLSVPTARKVEEEIALQAQVNAYREFRNLVEGYSRETGITPDETELRKAFYEAYNLNEGKFDERAQKLTGISSVTEAERRRNVAQPTAIIGNIESPDARKSNEELAFESVEEVARNTAKQYEDIFVNKGLSAGEDEEGSGKPIDLYGSSGFELVFGKAQQGSIIAAEGLFQVELAESPEDFQRKMAFLIELGIQAGNEAITDQEFSQVAKQAAKELGIDITDANFPDLRQKIAQEAAAEFQNAEVKIEELNRIIYDPSTSVSEKNKAIEDQNKIIESLAKYEQQLEQAQPGTRGEIIRLIAPSSPLDIVLTAFLTKTAASTLSSVVKAAPSRASSLGSRAITRVSEIDLKLSPAAQERLLRATGAKFVAQTEPRVARPELLEYTPTRNTGNALSKGDIKSFISQVNEEFRNKIWRAGLQQSSKGRYYPRDTKITPSKIQTAVDDVPTRSPELGQAGNSPIGTSRPGDSRFIEDPTRVALREENLRRSIAELNARRTGLTEVPLVEQQAITQQIAELNALIRIAEVFGSGEVSAIEAQRATRNAMDAGVDPDKISKTISLAQDSYINEQVETLESPERITTPTATEEFGISSPQLEPVASVQVASSLSEDALVQAAKVVSTEKLSQLKTVKSPSEQLQVRTTAIPTFSPASQPIISTEPASLDALKTIEQPATQPITEPVTQPFATTVTEPVVSPQEFTTLNQQPQVSSSPGLASGIAVASAANIGRAGPLRFEFKFPNSLATTRPVVRSKLTPIKNLDPDNDEEEKSPSQQELQAPSISAVKLFRLIPSNNKSVKWELRQIDEAGGPILEDWGPYAIPDILSSSILSDKGRRKLRTIFNTSGTRVTQGEDLILTLLALGRIGRNEVNIILPFNVRINSGDLTDA